VREGGGEREEGVQKGERRREGREEGLGGGGGGTIPIPTSPRQIPESFFHTVDHACILWSFGPDLFKAVVVVEIMEVKHEQIF
jgi:hypothetical protein